VPFGKENVNRVTTAHGESELARASSEIHRHGLCTVNTAQINRQVPIDEYEDVVVAVEGELLVALERECGRNRQREVVIVRIIFIAEEFPVDREKQLILVYE